MGNCLVKRGHTGQGADVLERLRAGPGLKSNGAATGAATEGESKRLALLGVDGAVGEHGLGKDASSQNSSNGSNGELHCDG